MTRTYFPCVLLAALAFGLAGCDSNDESDADGSSTVTVAGSEADSFRGNAVFYVDEDEEDGDDLIILLFEGPPEDFDFDDDFVLFLLENRTTIAERSYDIDDFFELGGEGALVGGYQRDDNLYVSTGGDLDVSSASGQRISASYSFEADSPFGKTPGPGFDVSGSFRAVRVDTTALPGIFDGERSGSARLKAAGRRR